MDRATPSEGVGCWFESSRPHHSPDESYLARALELAVLAERSGDVPIGAVLVIDGRTFEAKNEKELRPDPAGHAEILALRAAARELGRWRLSGATLYVTKEPCVMCAGAMVAARIGRLVYGCHDPKGGAAGSVLNLLDHAGLNHRVEVTAGVLAEPAAAQLREFFARRR